MTQKEVADRLEWSTAKVIRVEAGSVSVSVTDLRALMDLYAIRGFARRESLIALARSAKRQPFGSYRSVLTPETIRYFGYEAAAKIIRQFEPVLIPGLLQTESYAIAILRDVYEFSEDETNRLVEARQERQEIFDREERPAMRFILGEAVISYEVGGPNAMCEQLEHLLALEASKGIIVQILPFNAGANFGMRGPFIYLEFPDIGDDDVLYLEDMRGGTLEQFRDDPDATSPYLSAWFSLEHISLTHDESMHVIRERARLFSSQRS